MRWGRLGLSPAGTCAEGQLFVHLHTCWAQSIHVTDSLCLWNEYVKIHREPRGWNLAPSPDNFSDMHLYWVVISFSHLTYWASALAQTLNQAAAAQSKRGDRDQWFQVCFQSSALPRADWDIGQVTQPLWVTVVRGYKRESKSIHLRHVTPIKWKVVCFPGMEQASINISC